MLLAHFDHIALKFRSEIKSLVMKDMVVSSDYRISKPALLAVLLYARGPKGEVAEQIIGKTRLMKLFFLILKEGGFEEHLEGKNTFEAYKYGPFDAEVYDALEALESMKIIETNSEELTVIYDVKYDKKIIFNLTELGKEKTKNIIEKMPSKLYNNIETIKIIYSRKPLIQLLHYVYSKYDEYSLNTELDIL